MCTSFVVKGVYLWLIWFRSDIGRSSYLYEGIHRDAFWFQTNIAKLSSFLISILRSISSRLIPYDMKSWESLPGIVLKHHQLVLSFYHQQPEWHGQSFNKVLVVLERPGTRQQTPGSGPVKIFTSQKKDKYLYNAKYISNSHTTSRQSHTK